MSTLRVTEIQSNSTSFATEVRFETSGGVENGKLAKAWVNFNGVGTVGIRNDFNVNTISDRGTGRFTVNFSTSLSTGYAVVCQVRLNGSTENVRLSDNVSYAAGSFGLDATTSGNSNFGDSDVINCIVMD